LKGNNSTGFQLSALDYIVAALDLRRPGRYAARSAARRWPLHQKCDQGPLCIY
jgi:hypothetical protein